MNKLQVLAASILIGGGCTTSPKHIVVCEPKLVGHVCPEPGHGPCPMCPKVEESLPIYFQAFDSGWDDPNISPIFKTWADAEEYVKRNNMGGAHGYEVRVINHRFEVRQVNDDVNDKLYTANEYNDAYDYVVEYSSAHSDLIIYDLQTGKQYEETP